MSVRDHGRGFAEQDLPHVFDRFYRASDARSTTGSGLGLAIVRQAAESHGGARRGDERPRRWWHRAHSLLGAPRDGDDMTEGARLEG